MENFDLIIIGGGPTGLNCAIEAEKAGLKYVVLEKGVLVNSIYNFPINMTFFSTSKLLEIGNIPFISHGEKPTRREALEYYRRLAEVYQLKVQLYEPVLNMEARENGSYYIKTKKKEYHCQFVIVATGFYDTPRMLNVPGEELPKVKHYYDDPHPYAGQKVIVVGARNSACDVALETYYKGAEVTMIIRESEIYERVKYWIKPNIENRIKEGSIKAYFNSNITAIRPFEVDVQTPQGPLTLENDFVMAMTGYKPNYDFFKILGITFSADNDKIPVYDKDTLETNLSGVYMAGVVCAGMQTSKLFIENTRNHAEIIISDIEKKKKIVAI